MKISANIVYLYSEVMPYTITVMEAMRDQYGVDIHCVYLDINKKSPFVPTDKDKIYFHKRSSFNKGSLIEFISKLEPPLIYISGRMDKEYLQATAAFRGKILVISGFDNQWHGTIKNYLQRLFSWYLYRRHFDYLWIPAHRQFEFAKKLGFKNGNILMSLYCADTAPFLQAYEKKKQRQSFPHSIVFVGRFVKLKGLDLLVKAFTEAKEELKSDWKLVLVGSGDLGFEVDSASGIEVKSFMTTQELSAHSIDWGVFCLPSTSENWGAVVHEFSASGMPLICSDVVGSLEAFIVDGYNGYSFRTGNADSLKVAVKKLMQKSDEELWLMGQRSVDISKTITPQKSAASFMSVLLGNKN
jgi:glycosyltransferase involved in cell wall biosynthesis